VAVAILIQLREILRGLFRVTSGMLPSKYGAVVAVVQAQMPHVAAPAVPVVHLLS
jgi:hypothetical protein